MTISEAARRLGYDPSQLYRLINDGYLQKRVMEDTGQRY